MSKSKKSLLSKKQAAGVLMVSLSGFVPQAYMQTVDAAVASIALAGNIPSGITLGNPKSIKFGDLVATAKIGAYGLKTDNGTTNVVGAVKAAAGVAGKFDYKALVAANIDITISKLGPLSLAAVGGAGPFGTVKLNKIRFATQLGGVGLTLTAVGTKASTANYAATKQTGVANAATFGGTLSWDAAGNPVRPPVGALSVASGGIVITINY